MKIAALVVQACCGFGLGFALGLEAYSAAAIFWCGIVAAALVMVAVKGQVKL